MRTAFKLHKSFLMITTLLVYNINFAQTKEETVNYINDIVNMSKGVRFATEYTTNSITRQSFSLDAVTISGQVASTTTSTKKSYVWKYSDIPWSTMSSVFNYSNTDDLVEIKIRFGGKLNLYTASTGENVSQASLVIYVLPDKLENVDRALLHLQKLSEVKDLFGN